MLLTISLTSASDILEQVEHGFVDNNGVKIHFVTLGEGPLIVMVHGYPDFWYTWRHQMRSLSDKYQVVAVDLRGYNKSDKPAGVAQYAMRYLIGDIAAVIQHFPQKQAVLVGHDWGGGIAWQVALWRPELIKKLVVLSTPHPTGLIRELTNNTQQQKDSKYAENLQKENAHQQLTAEGLASWVQDDAARKIYVDAFRRSDFEAMLNYYKASYPKPGAAAQQAPNPATSPRRVKCPTLGIFGLQDKALHASGWNGTWDWIDNSVTLISIPTGGHFIQQEAPDKISQAIRLWLEL